MHLLSNIKLGVAMNKRSRCYCYNKASHTHYTSQHSPLYTSSDFFYTLSIHPFLYYPFCTAPGGRFTVLNHCKPPTGIKKWLPWLTELMQVVFSTYKQTGLFDALHITFLGASVSKHKILGKIIVPNQA